MGESKYAIEMDFQAANKQADKLEEIARMIETEAQQNLITCMNKVADSWKGDNAQSYCDKGKEVAENLMAIAKHLKKTSGVMHAVVKRHYDAEMAAIDIARNSGSGDAW